MCWNIQKRTMFSKCINFFAVTKYMHSPQYKVVVISNIPRSYQTCTRDFNKTSIWVIITITEGTINETKIRNEKVKELNVG